MESEATKHCGKAASHAAAAVPAKDGVASDEIAGAAFTLDKVGTRMDQHDMMRMGKSQHFKVCLDSLFPFQGRRSNANSRPWQRNLDPYRCLV